jgi:hypothetical protein
VKWIWVTIVGVGFTNGFYFAAFTVALPLLVTKVLHGSAATFGVIGAAGGVGEVIGALLAGNLRVRKLGLAIYAANAAIGLSSIGYGVPLLPVVLLGAAGFGASIVFSNTLWDTAIQKHVPADLIGRVTSIDWFGSILVGPVAPIAAAAAIPLIGPGALFLIAGGVSIIYAVVAPAVNRSIRDLE